MFASLRLRLAARLVRALGYRLVRQDPYLWSLGQAVTLDAYARRSGHLTRGFRAGKVMQRGLDTLVRALAECGSVAW